MTKLGRLPNPFPLVKLPYNRIVTPWTLGAIPHEIGHNLHSDLGLWLAIPRRVLIGLRTAGISKATRKIWVRWTKEIFADVIGILLIGPSFVGSLMDVVGKSAQATVQFNSRGVHPTPYLRTLINLNLLARIGFRKEADEIRRAWLTLYPPKRAQGLPSDLMATFKKAVPIVIGAMAFTSYPQLGDKQLSQVIALAD